MHEHHIVDTDGVCGSADDAEGQRKQTTDDETHDATLPQRLPSPERTAYADHARRALVPKYQSGLFWAVAARCNEHFRRSGWGVREWGAWFTSEPTILAIIGG